MGRLLHHKVKTPDLGKLLSYISSVGESVRSFRPESIPLSGRTLGIISLALVVLGMIRLTALLEPLASVFGYLAYRNGERLLGRAGMVAGVAITVFFLLLYFLIFAAPEQQE